ADATGPPAPQSRSTRLQSTAACRTRSTAGDSGAPRAGSAWPNSSRPQRRELVRGAGIGLRRSILEDEGDEDVGLVLDAAIASDVDSLLLDPRAPHAAQRLHGALHPLANGVFERLVGGAGQLGDTGDGHGDLPIRAICGLASMARWRRPGQMPAQLAASC